MQNTPDKNALRDLDSVKIREIFEGPLDLLLYLIHVNEIDIYNIPIAEITEQYLQYVSVIRDLNLDQAGEFLIMAAKLIYIKSRMLLPLFDEQDMEDVEDPRTELVERLIEHEKFRAQARILSELEQSQSQYIPRDNIIDTEVEFEIEDLSIDELIRAYQMTIEFKSSFDYKYITVNQIDINEKIEFIVRILKEKKKTKFAELLPKDATKLDLIVFFLALLELHRKKFLKVAQRKFLGNISITMSEE